MHVKSFKLLWKYLKIHFRIIRIKYFFIRFSKLKCIFSPFIFSLSRSRKAQITLVHIQTLQPLQWKKFPRLYRTRVANFPSSRTLLLRIVVHPQAFLSFAFPIQCIGELFPFCLSSVCCDINDKIFPLCNILWMWVSFLRTLIHVRWHFHVWTLGVSDRGWKIRNFFSLSSLL